MKTLLTCAILLLIAISFNLSTGNEAGISVSQADTSDVNPNGSSELALLMRQMQQYASRAKTDIKNNKVPEDYPTAIDKIYTAKQTEKTERSEYFKQFADLYVMSVKNYVASTKETRVETFNNMISSCLACHSQHCQGPVPAIRKLSIPVPE